MTVEKEPSIEEKLLFIRMNRKHGIIGKIAKRTDLARITISQFLDGDIYRRHVENVINIAYEEVQKQN